MLQTTFLPLSLCLHLWLFLKDKSLYQPGFYQGTDGIFQMFNSRDFHEGTDDKRRGQGWRINKEWWSTQRLANTPFPCLTRERKGLQCQCLTKKVSAEQLGQQGTVALKLYFSKRDPQTSSISNTRKPIRNANSQALACPTNLETRLPDDSDVLKFENHWL